ncbi:MAG: SMP-30/gluconolactonase/LRE family protein [Cyanobacteria bacterium J06597_1]
MSSLTSRIVVAYESSLFALISADAPLKKLSGSALHSEGPVYCPEDDSVIWSDVKGNRLLKWSADTGTQTIRSPSHYQNGNFRDLDGRIVSCSHGRRAIIRQEHCGSWSVLVDRYREKRLNSPNDLVVKSDGTIWFTDPPFGLTQPGEGYEGLQEQAGSFVYRYDPHSNKLTAVITEMERPNGLAFNSDESILYVTDTSQVNYAAGHHYVRAYDVDSAGNVSNGRVFTKISPGQPDGLIVHTCGYLCISSADSIQVYNPAGTCLGKILVPEVVTNLTIGGHRSNTMFITAGKSLYSIQLVQTSTQSMCGRMSFP